MPEINHAEQQRIWDEEHRHPLVLPQMDSSDPSSGVVAFVDWIEQNRLGTALSGIELGCGKGRNVIGLAKLGLNMTGIDFSPAAIKEAKRRAMRAGLSNRTNFQVHDATLKWPFLDDTFDFGIDCFATTDIENPIGRQFAVDELKRVIKPGGHILAYLLSPEDEFHNLMMKQSPAAEKHAFLHPTNGKFEKTFDREEILQLYKDLTLVAERRLEKVAEFFGKEYNCYHYWMVFEK